MRTRAPIPMSASPYPTIHRIRIPVSAFLYPAIPLRPFTPGPQAGENETLAFRRHFQTHFMHRPPDWRDKSRLESLREICV